MGALTEMPPVGYYLAREAGRLAGVSGDRMGQWARYGYIRSSQGTGRPRVYSYQDVAEAMVVHELVDEHVSFENIKSAIQLLRSDLGSGWPLSQGVFQQKLAIPRRGGKFTEPGGTEGIPRLKRRELRPVLIANDTDMSTMSGVFPVDLRRITDYLSRGGWVVRSLPGLTFIEVDPNRLSGQPVIRGSRVSAEFAGSMAETPEGREILRDGYDLTDDEVNDAERWWKEVKKQAS